MSDPGFGMSSVDRGIGIAALKITQLGAAKYCIQPNVKTVSGTLPI